MSNEINYNEKKTEIEKVINGLKVSTVKQILNDLLLEIDRNSVFSLSKPS